MDVEFSPQLPERERNVEAVAATIESIAARDFGSMDRHLAPGCRIRPAPMLWSADEPVLFRSLAERFRSLDEHGEWMVLPREVRALDDRLVLVDWILDVRHHGRGGGLALRGGALFGCAEGRILRVDSYDTLDEARRAAGRRFSGPPA